jgi:hypothetical protein
MALEIFRLVGSVFVDTDKADKSLKKTDKNAEGFGSKLVSVGKAAGKFALGVAGAAAAAGTAIVAMTENTREYRTEQGKLKTAFDIQNFSAETARKTYTALNGVLGDSGQAVEAANHLAQLAANEKELVQWTNIATGVYATFGDSLPIEGLTEAANETAKTGALTGGLADALNWAGVNEDEFQKKLDACNSEQERAALITSTMNGLYSEASEKYKELNADVIAANESQDRINNAMASAGAAMEPFVTKGKELLAEVLERLTPALEWLSNTALPWVSNAVSQLSDWFGELIGKLEESGITFDSIMAWIKDAFAVAVKFIKEYWEAYGQPVFNYWKQAVGLVYEYFKERMPQIKEFVSTTFKDIMSLWENDLQPTLKAIGDFIENVLAPTFKWVFENIISPIVDNVFRTIGEYWTNGLKPGLEGIIDFIGGVFSGDWKKAWDGIVKAFGASFEGFLILVKYPINGAISLINQFISKINGVKIPDWVPGMGGDGVFNIKQIPYLASGGVLEQGQVGLLEGSGAEAVVPLDHNKRWTKAVAKDMDAALGGSGQTAELLQTLIDLQERTLQVMAAGQKIVLNERELGRTVRSLA